MKVDRRFLYWGVFFIAAGAVMVAVDLRALDAARVLDALRLWPIALVAVGAAILLRHSRVNPAAWVVAAALPGLLIGGVVVAAPRAGITCNATAPAITQNASGTFSGPASVDVEVGCGTLDVTTAPGADWAFQGGNTTNAAATVNQTPTSLSILSVSPPQGLDFGRRSLLRLALPTSPIDRLNLQLNAGEGDIDLAGASVSSLQVVTNAGRSTVDLGGAAVSNVSATLNAGELLITMPDRDVSGSLVANAGRLAVCVPAGVGVQVERTGVLGGMTYGGLQVNGELWQSPDYAQAAHHANLTVHVNLAGIEINPNGGCR